MTGSDHSKRPRTRADYVQRVRSKGKVYTYYRREGLRFPIQGEEGSAEWHRSYASIHETFQRPGTEAPRNGSFAALVAAYRGSPDFLQEIGAKTRKDYGRYLDRLASDYGHLPVKTMPRAFIFRLRDKFAATPRTANYYVQVVRLLMTFAVDRGWRDDNPALRPKQLKTGPGHRPWEEFEIAAFRARWAANSLERVAFELLLNTGQRGQDVAAMTRKHYRRGWIAVCQQKTGERVDIPVSKDLKAVLDPWLKGHKHFMLLTTPSGRPLKIDYLRHVMANAYEVARLENVTTHGLRYTAGTILAELGCDWETTSAILGHKTVEMVRTYTGKKRKAKLAISRLDEARSKRDENEDPPKV